MRVIAAPDKFKGSLTGAEAAAAIRRGVLRAQPAADVVECPLSDGGEGFAAVMRRARGGSRHPARVTGPLGAPVDAEWTLLPDGRTAVIESAAAIGLGLVPPGERRATLGTTRGVGELLLRALDAGASRLLVGLGGSATTDGGAGLAQALGVRFDGAPAPIRAADLVAVRAVSLAGRDPRLLAVELVVAADVQNPLTGEDGAARAYAPQKGASPAEVELLERALVHLSAVAGVPGVLPGDGAAGGLGYGLRVFAGATVESGAEHVLDAVRFDELLRGADLVVTGEGSLDAQTARGKVVACVCRRAARRGVPAVALAGRVAQDAASGVVEGLSAAYAIGDGVSESESIARAAELLEASAARAVTAFASAPRSGS